MSLDILCSHPEAKMDTGKIPEILDHAISMFLFAIGIFLVAVHTTSIAAAAGRSGLGERTRVLAPIATGAFLAAWLGIAIAAGDGVRFPLSADARQALSGAVGLGPVLLAAGLLFFSTTVRALNAAMEPASLIRVQAYRMGGILFLYPFLYYGVLPAGFAIPAAVGDFLTGLAAPFVAAAVERRRPSARAFAIAWTIFGITDLVVAPVAAVLTRSQVLSVYPLALVALFIGPPLGILTHLWSLRNLAATASEVHGETPVAAALT